jgi:TatD DNase family protein
MAMKYVDVHAHLEEKRFEKDLDKVVERAEKVGVKFVINSGVNPETNRKALELTKKYKSLKASFGLYPVDSIVAKVGDRLSDDYPRKIEGFDVDEEIKWIEKNAKDCVAIGEVGLDYQVAGDFKEEQKEVFEKVILLANRLKKPLIIHSRKAEADAIEMLEKLKAKSVVMHCFNGKKSLIKKGVELGFYFSVPPVITRLNHFEMLVAEVPLTQLLTETDAPYLSPVAGERNEPMNVAITVKKIAEIKNISEEEVAKQIFKNAEELFDL